MPHPSLSRQYRRVRAFQASQFALCGDDDDVVQAHAANYLSAYLLVSSAENEALTANWVLLLFWQFFRELPRRICFSFTSFIAIVLLQKMSTPKSVFFASKRSPMVRVVVPGPIMYNDIGLHLFDNVNRDGGLVAQFTLRHRARHLVPLYQERLVRSQDVPVECRG